MGGKNNFSDPSGSINFFKTNNDFGKKLCWEAD